MLILSFSGDAFRVVAWLSRLLQYHSDRYNTPRHTRASREFGDGTTARGFIYYPLAEADPTRRVPSAKLRVCEGSIKPRAYGTALESTVTKVLWNQDNDLETTD